ncbi:hypothetical protein [Microcoleus sp. B5-C4]
MAGFDVKLTRRRAVPFPYSDRSLDGCTSSTWNLLYLDRPKSPWL